MKKLLYKISLTLVFLFAIIFTSKAQTWPWAKTCDSYTSGSGYSDGTAICTDPSGNVFITGIYADTLVAGTYTLNSPNGYSAPYIIKYDANGNVSWAKTSISTATNTNSWGMSVCSDAGGNCLLTGHFTSPNITFGTYTLSNAGFDNMFLVKYDPSGNVLWAKNPVDTSNDYSYSVSCDASNNVYVTGTFANTTIIFGTTTLTSIYSQKMFLVKYDANGNVLWAKCNSYGDITGNQEFGVTVSSDPGGNTFVTGSFTSPTMVLGTYTLTNAGTQNIFLAKYDPNGNVIWAKTAVGSTADHATSISTDGVGSVYITGYYTSALLSFGTYTLNNAGTQNMFLAKYDNAGNELWVRTSIDTDSPLAYSVSSNSLAVFITGSMNYSVTLGGFSVSAVFPSDPAFTAKYDVNGNVLFAQAFDSGGDDWITISADKFCNAYITGDLASPVVIGTNTLIVTGGESTFTAKISFSSNCLPLPDGVSHYSNLNAQYSIFPNPNSGIFKLQIDQIENGELILINSLGKKVFEQKIIQGENEIITKGLSAGLFHYIILQNKQQVSKGKIIIE